MKGKIDIAGIHVKVDKDLEKYIIKKISKLEKYLPKNAKGSTKASVKITENQANKKDKYSCEVILTTPGETLTAKEGTMNMYAAVDIVEAKLKTQLKKYHDKKGNKKNDRKTLLGKLRGMYDKDFWGRQN